MKKTVALAAFAVCIITGCGFEGNYGYSLKKEEQETEYSTVYAEVIEFSNLPNREYQSELNMSVRNNVESAIREFDAMALEAKPDLPDGVKSGLYLTQEVKRNSGGILSFIESHYIYTGGAHGTTTWYATTVNVNSESPHNLQLSELFEIPDYLEKLNDIMLNAVKEDPEQYSGLWAEPKLTKDTENQFYVTDNDLVIYFPPYILSYYAKGFIEFPIRLTEISGLLNEEYRVGEV